MEDHGVRDGERRAGTWSGTVVLAASLAAACGAGRELPALHRAARVGDVRTIETLVKAGAAVDARDSGPNGWTPMQHAVHKGQAAAVRALLAAGADPNATGPLGTTPLIMAAGYGQLEIVEVLLAAGADPRRENHDNLDALWAAAGWGAIADITDGPPLGSCFPDVTDAILAKAPDMRLRWGFESRLTYWLARKDCKRLIDRLR
jgi:hypothetical protein